MSSSTEKPWIRGVLRPSPEVLTWEPLSQRLSLGGSPGPLWEPTMHLENHLVDAELGRGASLTPAGNQLSPWSVRFNYPYLSLNNCKCYCWSQELSRPLKTPRHFPDSLLSTGGKTMLLMSRTHHYPNSGEVCDVLKYPTCGFPVAKCWRKKKAAGLVAATQWERDVRGEGQNLRVGGWETPGKFLHLPGLLCCCMSSASVSGKKEWRWVYGKMGKMGKGLDSPRRKGFGSPNAWLRRHWKAVQLDDWHTGFRQSVCKPSWWAGANYMH